MVIILQTSMPFGIYEESFKIHTYEVDLHNRLTIQSLCQFFQEAASNHASLLGFGVEYLLGNSRTWVLSRLAVEIEEFISLGDTITVKTWPADTEKLFFIRDFEIANSAGKLIGSATSYWIFLNTETKRPIHPSKREIVYDYKGIPRAFNRKLEKLTSMTDYIPSKSFHVRYSDLDLNNHVNNIEYIGWGLEGIDPDYRKNRIPFSLEINYLTETKYGDEVGLSMKKGPAGDFFHSLFIKDTEICRIRSIWKAM